jgi:hypothetical protein
MIDVSSKKFSLKLQVSSFNIFISFISAAIVSEFILFSIQYFDQICSSLSLLRNSSNLLF